MMYAIRTRKPGLPAVMVLLWLLVMAGCSRGGAGNEDDAGGAAPAAATDVPVSIGRVRREAMNVVVVAPGHTEALRKDRIRAPYASKIVSLRVTDGDHVKAGKVIAVIVSKDSEAALAGARQMLAAASNTFEKKDAERAVAVAKRNLVEQSLEAPADGVVLSHAAETGDYVDVNEVLVTIAETSTVYFKAQVPQSEVGRVSPGQEASIDIPARGASALHALVNGLLPVASSANFSAPVRLDFSPKQAEMPLGLYGTARIIVAQHADATVVPARAVLRDDVTGITRIAVIAANDKVHWVTVDVGARENDQAEILEPVLAPGTRVITDGQVGLPEGAGVVAQ